MVETLDCRIQPRALHLARTLTPAKAKRMNPLFHPQNVVDERAQTFGVKSFDEIMAADMVVDTYDNLGRIMDMIFDRNSGTPKYKYAVSLAFVVARERFNVNYKKGVHQIATAEHFRQLAQNANTKHVRAYLMMLMHKLVVHDDPEAGICNVSYRGVFLPSKDAKAIVPAVKWYSHG